MVQKTIKAFVEKAPPKEPQTEKPDWKSKTFRFNLLVLLVSFWPEVRGLLGEYQGTDALIYHIGTLIALVNIYLRYKTKGPIGGSAYLIGQGGKQGGKQVVKGVKWFVNLLPGVTVK